jgi:hypothetical protein
MYKRIFCIVITICALALLTSCGTANADTQGYMLAFVESGSNHIRVRVSRDGISWENSEFRDVPLTTGIGAAADYSGLMRIISWTTFSHLAFASGMGTSFDMSAYRDTDQAAISAPSAVYGVSGKSWIFAYRTSGDVIAVRIFDLVADQFLDINCAPIEGAQNDSVLGRPALVRLGTTIVLAWGRKDSDEIRIAVGKLSETEISCPTWINKYGFTPPKPNLEGELVYDSISSSPTLTHDYQNFYLGYTQYIYCSTCVYANSSFFLHSSADGISWSYPVILPKVCSPYDWPDENEGPYHVYANIAGRSDGSVIAAIVASGNYEVYKISGGKLTKLDANSVFGFAPADIPFALVSVGHPAPPNNNK